MPITRLRYSLETFSPSAMEAPGIIAHHVFLVYLCSVRESTYPSIASFEIRRALGIFPLTIKIETNRGCMRVHGTALRGIGMNSAPLNPPPRLPAFPTGRQMTPSDVRGKMIKRKKGTRFRQERGASERSLTSVLGLDGRRALQPYEGLIRSTIITSARPFVLIAHRLTSRYLIRRATIMRAANRVW